MAIKTSAGNRWKRGYPIKRGIKTGSWVAALVGTALWLTAALVWAIEAPVLPPDKTLVADRSFYCEESRTRYYAHYYDLDGKPQYAELVVRGRLDSSDEHLPPLSWVYFKPETSEVEKVILTLPGTAPEQITIEELERRYPEVCDLFKPIL